MAMLLDDSWLLPLSITVLTVALLTKQLIVNKRSANLLPGPRPLPFIGNVFDSPRKDLGREYLALTRKYGEVVGLTILGQSMVIIGSMKAATDLLEKRSANYSDRPVSIMAQMVGFHWLFVLMNYGAEWRQHRRAFHQVMNPDVISDWQPVQLKVSRDLLRNILHSPEQLALHLQFSFAAIVMRVAYGIELDGGEGSNEYFQMVKRLGDIGEDITVPGRYFVDAVPMLRFIPSWLPGGQFKRYAAKARLDILSIRHKLFQSTKDAMKQGNIRDCVITRLWKDEGDAEMEEVCRGLAATIYAAGADTTFGFTRAFFLAMARYPEPQKKAQMEIDRVVGTDRLPEFSDLESLPYVCALVKEVLRWHALAPIAMPHRAVADDQYNGYLIPRGATVIVNCWGISQDPKVYPDPEHFLPERFLDHNGQLDVGDKDPSNFAFGFGRRICPGRHFAEASLNMLVASVLSTFNIQPPTDEIGVPVTIEHETTTNAIVSHAKLYDYLIVPRSARAKQLIQEQTGST